MSFVPRLPWAILATALLMPRTAQAQTTPSPFTVLRVFTRATDGTGARDHARLIEATNGMIYGTNPTGGSFNGGTLFRVNKGGTGFTVLRHFAPADGLNPVTLLQARNGRLYGICNVAGTTPQATIFSVALDGSDFTVLRRFAPATDQWLPDTLIEGANGMLYGTAKATTFTDNAHAIFRMSLDGTSFVVLRALSAATEGAGDPTLIQGPDGRLYGTTQGGGGSSTNGVVFTLNPDGSGFMLLKRFLNTDGRGPNRLAFVDGQLVGTTRQGGPTANYGVLYRLRTDGGGFTLLHEFRGTFPPAAGEFPVAGATPLSDGNLYGVTVFGGGFRGYGTLYRYDPVARRVIFLKQFNWEDGVEPSTDLLAASDGRLYGIAGVGGALASGTLFSYDLNLPGANVGLIATVGQPFSHAHGFGASATGLPAGLSLSGSAGQISGTPTQAGTFQVTVTGPVSASIASNGFTLTVAKGNATVALGNLTHVHDGTAKTPSVTTVPAGLSVTFTYGGSPSAPSAPGSYSVIATINDLNYAGATTGTLVIGATAPRFNSPLADVSTVAGTGVTLRADVSTTPLSTFQWQRKARGEDAFSDVIESPTFVGVRSSTLAITTPTTAMHGDQFRVIVTNAAGLVTSEPATLLVRPASILANVSVRARVAPGEQLTVGVVTSGNRSLLLRGIGPGLAPFLGAGTAGDPAIVVSSPTNPRLDENDNWGGTAALAAAFTNLGAFALPTDSQDAVVLTPISGPATAQLSVRTAGLALIEAYDAGPNGSDRLVNLSALHVVGVGADALVAGFNIAGSGTKTLLVRGIGPALRVFGVGDPIEDPTLQVFRGSTQLAFNDDWQDAMGATFPTVGAFALTPGSKDAVLLLSVTPGSYTIQLSNAQNRAGPGLIEIYEVP